MRIDKINSITISKYENIIEGARYGCKLEITNPTNASVNFDDCDERGGLGNVVLWRHEMGLENLFASGADVVINGEFTEDNGNTCIGEYNMLTGKFKELPNEPN